MEVMKTCARNSDKKVLKTEVFIRLRMIFLSFLVMILYAFFFSRDIVFRSTLITVSFNACAAMKFGDYYYEPNTTTMKSAMVFLFLAFTCCSGASILYIYLDWINTSSISPSNGLFVVCVFTSILFADSFALLWIEWRKNNKATKNSKVNKTTKSDIRGSTLFCVE